MEKDIIDTQEHFYAAKEFDSHNSVAYLTKLLHQSFNKSIDIEMTPLGLTAMQWRPLLVLAKTPEITMADLARLLDIDAGAMSRMLDRLEQKNLLKRIRNNHDRRVVNIHLTPEGKKIAEDIPTCLCAAVTTHLNGLTHQDIEQFKSITRKMLHNSTSFYDC